MFWGEPCSSTTQYSSQGKHESGERQHLAGAQVACEQGGPRLDLQHERAEVTCDNTSGASGTEEGQGPSATL